MPLRDAALSNDDEWKVVAVAHAVDEALRDSQNVPITCRQGINRSPLVAATFLVIRGFTPGEAIRQLRKKRKLPGVLTNPAFNGFLRKELKDILEYLYSHGGRPPPHLGKGLRRLKLRYLLEA
jgi:protein-tyrosine phosphatase